MQGNVLGQTGSNLKINGIIEEYKVASGGKVNAGDFVKFVNGYNNAEMEIKNSKVINNTTDSGKKGVKAVLLNQNKVFVTFCTGTWYCGAVCLINGIDIIVGEETHIFTSNINSLVVLNENKVFATTLSSTKILGIVCTISDMTVTKGTSTTIVTTTAKECKAIALNENKVFIVYIVETNNNSLISAVCNISGTTITPTIETIKFYSYANHLDITKLDENRVFIAYDYNPSTTIISYLHGIICQIENDSTIKPGTSVEISTVKWSGYMPYTVALNQNKVFLIRSNNPEDILGNDYGFFGMICDIEGVNFTVNEEVQLIKNETAKELYPVLIDESNILLFYKDSNYCLNMLPIAINEKTINIEVSTLISSSQMLYCSIPILVSNNTIFIVYDENIFSHYIAGMIYSFINTIEVKTIIANIEEIFGIAKTKGTEGEIVQVYRPKLAEYICTEEGNRIMTENREEIRNE